MKLSHPLINIYDDAAAENHGVMSDHMVSHSQGGMIRRIVYMVPETGQAMEFITNLAIKIPPGVIAQLYFMRWRIEKSFDEIKNKLYESKA